MVSKKRKQTEDNEGTESSAKASDTSKKSKKSKSQKKERKSATLDGKVPSTEEEHAASALSFLLPKDAQLDGGLDDIFKSSAGSFQPPPPPPVIPDKVNTNGVKDTGSANQALKVAAEAAKAKKQLAAKSLAGRKDGKAVAAVKSKGKGKGKQKEIEEEEEEVGEDDTLEKAYDAKMRTKAQAQAGKTAKVEAKGDRKKDAKRVAHADESDEEDEDEDDDQDMDGGEDAAAEAEVIDEEDSEGEDDDEEDENKDEDEDEEEDEAEESDDDDSNAPPPVHESLLQKSKPSHDASSKSSKKRKADETEAGETREDKDARTIFVGNLPVEVGSKRPLQKLLFRHLVSFLPSAMQRYAKQDSIRFRSVALSSSIFGRREKAEEAKESEGRSRKRARLWREVEQDEEGEQPAGKKMGMRDSEMKKVAFIRGEVNPGAKSINAYVVFDRPKSVGVEGEGEGEKVPKLEEIIALLVQHANNSTFLKHTLRVDFARTPSSIPKPSKDVPSTTGFEGEEKRSLYVGNLDFEQEEEGLRSLMEKLVVEARGKPDPSQKETAPTTKGAPEVEGETKVSELDWGKKEAKWVEGVRIIRDPKSGLGKGFAYVLFKDKDCIDYLLSVGQDQLKLSKRKLRVERCKPMAKLRALKKIGDRPMPSKSSAPTKGHPDAANKRERRMSSATSPGRASKPRAPRIDLGERLASLSKEERKAIKATDEDRIQRRLEKKKMKTAQGGDGLNEKGKVDLGRAKKKDGPVVGKKTRVRSDRNEIRKNTKK